MYNFSFPKNIKFSWKEKDLLLSNSKIFKLNPDFFHVYYCLLYVFLFCIKYCSFPLLYIVSISIDNHLNSFFSSDNYHDYRMNWLMRGYRTNTYTLNKVIVIILYIIDWHKRWTYRYLNHVFVIIQYEVTSFYLVWTYWFFLAENFTCKIFPIGHCLLEYLLIDHSKFGLFSKDWDKSPFIDVCLLPSLC